MSTAVSLHVCDPSEVTAQMRDELQALAHRYLDLEGDWFTRRVVDCDRLLVFRERASGRICGTSTLDVVDLEHDARRVRALYTGAVVIASHVRGLRLIERAGAWCFARFGVATRRKVYWFYECDSYRGYRLSTRYGRGWPRRDCTPPAFEEGLYARLCRDSYGAQWDPARGVCAAIPGRVLRPSAAAIPVGVSKHPDVAFFVERNPGYAMGEALPVLVPLDAANWLTLAQSMLGRSTAVTADARATVVDR
jgi:hypothetical protein